MTRKYSSVSVNTTLAIGLSNSASTMTVATGTAASLLGGVSLGAASGGVYPDQFTVAIDPDTANEEIVFVVFISSDTLTIQRGKAGSSAITHAGGATVKHVLTGNDLDYFNTAIQPSIVTAKGDIIVASSSSTPTNISVGTDGQVLTADSTQTKGLKWATPTTGTVTSITAGTGLSGGTITTTGTIAIDSTVATLTGSQTLTNKTLTAPVLTQGTSTPTFSSNAYTLVAGDAGLFLLASNSTTAGTISIPTDATYAFPNGTQIHIQQTGTGQLTIQAATSGTTTVVSNGATAAAPKIRAQYSVATIMKTSTNNWTVYGDIA